MITFVVNPSSHSGKGQKLWDQVRIQCDSMQLEYEVLFSQAPGELKKLMESVTEKANAANEITVILLGGDGTVNEALQGLKNREWVRLGYLPTGSSNDLARDMGYGKKTLAELLDKLILNPDEILMDLGCVCWEEDGQTKKHYFSVSCGIGYDAAVCVEALSSKIKDTLNRFGLGKLTYLGIGIKQMATIALVNGCMILDDTKEIPFQKLLFAAMMSHRFEGGGFMFAPEAKCDDGILDLCVVQNLPRWKFPFAIPCALLGKHFLFKGVDSYQAKKIRVELEDTRWLHTDGEVPGKGRVFDITVEQKVLRFLNCSGMNLQ